MLQSLVSCLFFSLFLVYLKGSDMFLNDLLDLHDLSLTDSTALNELRDAVAVYAEENDMLFTEVLDLLKEPS